MRAADLISRAMKRRRIDLRLAAAALVVLYLSSGTYLVSADQQAVVLRLGRMVEGRVPAGVHWTWPYPIARVYRLRVRETKRLTIGLDAGPPKETQFLTGDRNILNVRLVVQYAINDPGAYLFRTADVSTLLANTVRGALVQVAAGRNVDDLLTTGKVDVQERVQGAAQATLERLGCGISLLGVVLDAIVPPDQVVDAFRLVASAREDSDRIVREAESYANGVVPVARGDAARMGEEAETYKSTIVNDAIGEAARFSGIAAEYAKAPAQTETRLYLETMDEVLPKLDKTIVGTDPKSVDLQFLRRK